MLTLYVCVLILVYVSDAGAIAIVNAIIGSLPTLIPVMGGALLLLVQGWRNAAKATATATVQTDKLNTIHDLTNSRLSEMDRKLAVALETITGLEKQLGLMVQSKIETAMMAPALVAAARAEPPPPPPPTPPTPSAVLPLGRDIVIEGEVSLEKSKPK